MIEKVALADVVDRLHAHRRRVVAEILQRLLDKRPITPARLIAEFRTTAPEYLGDVA
jgi:hypothetical protein